MMMGYVDAPRAWGYTRGMARVLGVNLTSAVVEGWLSREELADLVVVSCPLCAFNLDFRQDDAKRLNPDFHNMPVLYFTQLMALAFDCDDAALRFDLHHIDPLPVLKARGLG